MNLAIIPARGGSKRIPGKNIKHFAGKPLIAYSIEAAIESELFAKVIVSTDCEEVKKVALAYGADVPFLRPEELSNDYVGTRPVTNHGIEYCIEHFFRPDYVCCIYATAPFLQPAYLREGIDRLTGNKNKSFAFSVSSFPFPIQRALKNGKDGIEAMFPEHIGQRSQDLEEAFHDAGQFYWGSTEGYLSSKAIFSSESIPVELPRYLVQDIDTPEDWDRAELMYRAYVEKNKGTN